MKVVTLVFLLSIAHPLWVEEVVTVMSPQDHAASSTQFPPDVERWRGLVSVWFEENTDAALSVMWCESRGNPEAQHPGSGAAGLFQHLPRYWEYRTGLALGYQAEVYPHIFNPQLNIEVAAWLSDEGTNWGHWVCKPQL